MAMVLTSFEDKEIRDLGKKLYGQLVEKVEPADLERDWEDTYKPAIKITIAYFVELAKTAGLVTDETAGKVEEIDEVVERACAVIEQIINL
jgi:hypothetical protein